MRSEYSSKLNIPLQLAAIMLCVTLISVYLVSGIFARYTTESSSGNIAAVAEFSPAASFVEDTWVFDSDTYSFEYQIKLTNPSEVDVNCSLENFFPDDMLNNAEFTFNDITKTNINGNTLQFGSFANLSSGDTTGITETLKVTISEDIYNRIMSSRGADIFSCSAFITDLWPTGVVPTSGSYAIPEWAPVDGCKYRTINGDNATLKVYTTVSAEIINDPDDSNSTKFVAWWANEALNDQYFHIYYSAIPDEETDTISYDGIEYVKQPIITYKMAYNSWTQITPYDYYGVQLREAIISAENPGSVTNETQNSTFYYTRNPHTLNFYNIDTLLRTDNLVYGQKIESFNTLTAEIMERDYYPSQYEKGAYAFKGWSLSPSTNVPVDWENYRMDDADLSVYAYWEKTTHKVTFYETYNDMKQNKPIADGENGDNEVDVFHGEPVSYASTISRDGYSFVGWFYLNENTNEKIAFLPN